MEFYQKNPRKVPNILAFTRILKRFQEESALRPQVPAGRSSEPLRNNIEAVKNFFEQNSKMPHKGGSKSPWVNLEHFEEESQVEGVQATLGAVSEFSQQGTKVGSLHFLVDF